ncbi:MAG: polysaccharide deacetylase family protein [Deltaproteobacteria bacterium]|nr:polysaccharide deacetylase family protein [Deltaproteobacteria bacterium]
MTLLKILGYSSIKPEDLLSFIKGDKPGVKKPVLITFDDGYKNNFINARPILKNLGFTSLIFISTGFIGKKRSISDERESIPEDFLDEKEIKLMHDDGFSVGSHGINHCYLDRLEEGVLMDELIASKVYLENMLKTGIDFFSYPFGSYNLDVISAVKRAGYLGAFTTVKGKVGIGDSAYEFKRISVNGYNTIFNFLYKIIFLQ